MMFKRFLFLCVAMVLVLTGCNEPVYNQTEQNAADVKQRIEEARNKADNLGKPIPSLVVNEGVYVDKTPINLAKEPAWLKNRIIVRGDQLPFSFYSRTMANAGDRNVLTHYQFGLDQSTKVTMNYTGTVQGALDQLAAKTGYVYNVNGHQIYWQAFVTKTFDIAFMPGSSTYMVGNGGGGSGGGGGGGSGGGASAGGASASSSAGGSTTSVASSTASSQYSSMSGQLSVWKDLEDSIKQLLSSEGKVMVSQATTSVTVRDRPSNVTLVSKFIANLNNNLSKQVLVKIQVLQVSLESDYDYGINWNLVQTAFSGGTYKLVASNGTPISISSVTGLTGGAATVGLDNPGMTGSPATRLTGVISLINALKQQGKVSVVTEPRVLCQNNQVSQISIVDQQTYLASVQTTSLSGSSTGGASITSQITPGTVITGFTLYVLPKILGDKVYMQVNADLSTNLGLQTITSNGAALSPNSTPPAGTSIIQAPHVQDKQFNQRSVIASGDTLILSGFRQVSNQTGASQLLDSQALGGKGAQQVNTETIVLITPIILHGFA